jgi:hypothetical protein
MSFNQAARFLGLVLVTLLVAAGCRATSIAGSGKVVSKSFSFDSFSRVVVSNRFIVNLSRSDQEKVTVRIDDNLVNHLDVRVSNEILTIGLRPRTAVHRATLEADVAVPTLSGIDLNGASRMHITDSLVGQALSLSVSGASSLDGPIRVEEVKADLSGASRASLTGTAGRLVLDGNGASNLGGIDLKVDALEVDLSGASEATVSVTNTVSASLSGASNLKYHGTPEFTKRDTSGASSISAI